MRSASSLPKLAPALEVAPWRGDFDRLAAHFAALEEPGRAGAAFRSWAWLSAWWKRFSPGREAHVLVATSSGNQGDMVGLLPLYAERSPLGGRRLALMGDGIVGSDYLGIIGRAADERTLARAFARHCATAQYDQLSLDGLAGDDPLVAALSAELPADRLVIEPRFRCPHIRIEGSFEQYLAGLADGTGAQWKRRLRWLEKRPGFAIELHVGPDAVVAALDILMQLHHKRWAVEGGSDAIDSPAVEAFHRDAAQALAARGWAHVWVLSVEGAPRAALYGWRFADRFAFYQAGYDPEWHQRSVGTVLLGHIVQRCFAEGVAEFDFLRGTEAYKLKWANGARETVRLRAHDGSLRARLHHGGRRLYWQLRDAGKRALPPTTLEWARRARRKVAR
jgi:CelD/BcsL family acetyltransferase involved in cellulose biosynthesis